MVSKNALRLVNDLLDNVAIFDSSLNLLCQGASLQKILINKSIDLNKLESGGDDSGPELSQLKYALETIRDSAQPSEFVLPGINEEFLILPTANGDFFFGLKNKIIKLSRIDLDLQERIKEIECLYSISKESDASSSLENFLRTIIKISPAGFQYPNKTVVAIEIAGIVYGLDKGCPQQVTDLFPADILLEGTQIGKMTVYSIEGPEFSIEEKSLIKEIAAKISQFVEKNEKTKNLNKQQKILKLKNEALLKMTDECYRKREELSTFFKAMSDKIVVIDTDHNIIMSNKDDIGNSGKCFNRLFNLDSPCENCPAARTFAEKNNSILALDLNDKHYTLTAHPIMGIDGNVDRVLEVCRDITERKRMETQLLQSYKLASLGKLVAGVAHEINNPNTFILGNLKILQESLTDIFPILDEYYKDNSDLKIARLNYDIFKENISVLVNDMINGANRTKKIVGDLRNFAKKDEDGLTDVVDLNELIRNNLNLTTKQINKFARLDVKLDEHIPKFKGNINRLEQVFLNIVMNAAEAIEKDDGFVIIRTGFDAGRNEIFLKVSDNGCGMDESTLNNIFDPFFTTKRERGGTGLGLSITYGIIKDHNGTIEVNSRPGEGTTFDIRIPVREAD